MTDTQIVNTCLTVLSGMSLPFADVFIDEGGTFEDKPGRIDFISFSHGDGEIHTQEDGDTTIILCHELHQPNPERVTDIKIYNGRVSPY